MEEPKGARFLALAAVLIAATAAATALLKVPIPTYNLYFHLGGAVIYPAALLFGPRMGFVVGGLGAALADTFLGYFLPWAPISFVIHGAEGYIVGRVGRTPLRWVPRRAGAPVWGVVAGGLVLIPAYAVAAGVLYGPAAVIPEIVGDTGQWLAGAVAGVAAARSLGRALGATPPGAG